MFVRPTPPSLLGSFDELPVLEESRRLVLFLDYDGTLTPIVRRPEMANLSPQIRESLRSLAERFPVAIVSGRDLEDVRRRVGVDELVYAGSHGFDIAGPRGLRLQQPDAMRLLPRLDEAETLLREILDVVPGCRIERKRFSLAIHYREVQKASSEQVREIVDQTVERVRDLCKRPGKKVYEIQPDVDWDKGRAVEWLLQELKATGPGYLPIYLGDDRTDEDAFRVIRNRGLGILIASRGRESAARYRLADPGEVRRLLDHLVRSSDEHPPL